MPDDTSSADPQALIAYSDAALRIDAHLESIASRLADSFGEFASTCTEYNIGVDASLADPLRSYAQRMRQNDLWVRDVAQQFLLADVGLIDTSPDAVAQWDPIEPTTTDWSLAITLNEDEFAQYLSPIDLNTQPQSPWDVALSGVMLFLKAAADAPTDCNNAFWSVALAAKDGPQALRDALTRSRPTCGQSRALMRMTTVLADGTPLELQQEVTLDEFIMQMTAAADGLGGNGTARRGWTMSTEQAQQNVRKGSAFENIVDSALRRLGKFPFFRSGTLRRGGFDLVSLEDGTIVFNELEVETNFVVVNEAKLQRKYQFDDFTAITRNFRRNVQEVLDNIDASELSAAERDAVRSTLEAYLRDGQSMRLRIRVVTGRLAVGKGVQAAISNANPGVPIEFVDIRDLVPATEVVTR